MNKRQAKRVQKWADHIEFGKLGHKRFDMRVIHDEIGNNENYCGSAGCSIGELPIVFPRTFIFRCEDIMHKINRSQGFSALESHFDISRFEALALFDSSVEYRRGHWMYETELAVPEIKFPESVLSPSNSRQDIAASMRRFVDWKMGLNKKEE